MSKRKTEELEYLSKNMKNSDYGDAMKDIKAKKNNPIQRKKTKKRRFNKLFS